MIRLNATAIHGFIVRANRRAIQSEILKTAIFTNASLARTQSSVINQKVAIGFNTEPVAKGTAAGDAVTRNSQRLRLAASLPICSRSQLSKIGIPIATS